jgi:acetoacetyl-[acyl-carrier protein] synthase
MSALGTFKYQLIPGIKTIDRVAADVCQTHTSFPLRDRDVRERGMDLALINSKGFGGNNATAVVISPRKVEDMLSRRYGAAMADYRSRLEQTRQRAADYELRADRAELDVIYRFGEQVIDDSAIQFSRDGLTMPGFGKAVIFDKSNPWADMS